VNRFRKICPNLITGQTIGSGHLSPLEVPDQINPMLERFVEVYAAKGEPKSRSRAKGLPSSLRCSRRNAETRLRIEKNMDNNYSIGK
jgi:hypothetical protein